MVFNFCHPVISIFAANDRRHTCAEMHIEDKVKVVPPSPRATAAENRPLNETAAGRFVPLRKCRRSQGAVGRGGLLQHVLLASLGYASPQISKDPSPFRSPCESPRPRCGAVERFGGYKRHRRFARIGGESTHLHHLTPFFARLGLVQPCILRTSVIMVQQPFL